MTRNIFREAIIRHVEAERRRDIDAIMASVADDPFYIIPGYELRGRAAVRTMYQNNMAALTPANADEYLRALDDPAVSSRGSRHLVLEYTPDLSDSLWHGRRYPSRRAADPKRTHLSDVGALSHPLIFMT